MVFPILFSMRFLVKTMMYRLYIIGVSTFFVFFGMSFCVQDVLAQKIITGTSSVDAVRQLNSAGALNSSASTTLAQDPRVTAAIAVRYFLSLLGTILLILIVMSGYWYFTARGDDEKITRAQTTIKQALMGMVLILTAYAIATYTINSLSSTLKEGDQDRVRDELRFDPDVRDVGDLSIPNF